MAEKVVFDTQERPPDALRALFKKWQKASLHDIESSSEILDARKLELDPKHTFGERLAQNRVDLSEAFQSFISAQIPDGEYNSFDGRCYGCNIPGLYIYPSLLPQSVQWELMNNLFHRDLSEPQHKTNIHLHYNMIYPTPNLEIENEQYQRSFFMFAKDEMLTPKDSTIHKAINVGQMLQRKLRWMTLGGQYDWTAKVYPNEEPPRFPDDINRLLRGLFPDVDAQAAIVNLYASGDTLSVHRDVSEECDRGLISISIGCDGLFLIGSDDGTKTTVVRLRSGDAVLMSGEARFAWHGVPKIIPDTCPETLRSWPQMSGNDVFSDWQGWLANKRINLNVRQMKT